MTASVVEVRRQPSRIEFRAFAGVSMASAAISIDLILPAFSKIRADLGPNPAAAREIDLRYRHQGIVVAAPAAEANSTDIIVIAKVNGK